MPAFVLSKNLLFEFVEPMIFGPNIIGTASGFYPETSTQPARFSGAFAEAGYTNSTTGGNVSAGIRKMIYKASLSSPIYTDDATTVQAPANQNLIIIKF